MTDMRHLKVVSGDVTLHCRTYGPSEGPLALCAHGFPDSPSTYRHLTEFMVALGYHVVVPATRGYAPSSVSPSGDYGIAALGADLNRIHDAAGGDERAVLIGHDWGAVAAYRATNTEPDRWRRAVALAVPPQQVFQRAFLTYEQLRASWYMFFFQSPLADLVVGLDDMAFVARLWQEWSPGYDATADLVDVRAAIAEPHHLAAALGYYRTLFAPRSDDEPSDEDLEPTVATLYLHGQNDGCFLRSSLGDPLEFLARGSRVECVPGAGHWLHLEQPVAVHQAIAAFLER